jgi:hypothetical protein
MEKFEKYISKNENYIFVIEEDLPGVGWYLYVYENDRCIYDYLQDTFKVCQEQAHEDFGVPLNSWKKEE